ncbi:MAG: hypothetical protein WAW92_02605 [Minisyncoccia bacterium]
MKSTESSERFNTGREVLKSLEGEGVYVFHGSPDGGIPELEPRQGTHMPDDGDPDLLINDGDPAVSATPYADVAIFRAIINKRNIEFDHTSAFGMKGNLSKPSLFFTVSSTKVLEEAKSKSGFVYVFNKSDFEKYDREGNLDGERIEWRSYKPVKPLMKVGVNFDDVADKEQIEIGL